MFEHRKRPARRSHCRPDPVLRHGDFLDGDLRARSTTGASAQSRDGAKIRDQPIDAGGLSLGRALGMRLHLQEQQRRIAKPLAPNRIGGAVRGVQPSHLPNRNSLLAKSRDQRACVSGVGPGQRQQILHRCLRWDLPRRDFGLHLGREYLAQAQSARHPALGTAQPPSQLFQRQPFVLGQVFEQPCLLQRRARVPFQVEARDQRFAFAQRPQRRLDHVAAQAAQNIHAQVTIDKHVAPRRRRRDHHHRHLLPSLAKR